MIFFKLKNDLPDLALAEARAAVHGWGWWKHDEGPLFDALYFKRHLGLTRKVIEVKESCPKDRLNDTLRDMTWEFKGTYKVRSEDPELQDIIWRSLDDPKVDLEDPDNVIDIVEYGGMVHIGLLAWKNEERFSERVSARLPRPHPTGLQPHVARALVNLACSETICDPFCGAGGLLVEAGLAGLTVKGGDISEDMISRAEANLRSFGVQADLQVADATEELPECEAIVTDLPFGKNTKDLDLDALLHDFLGLAKTKTGRLVVGLPRPITTQGWMVRAHFTQYVHKNMTRHFYVLEPGPQQA